MSARRPAAQLAAQLAEGGRRARMAALKTPGWSRALKIMSQPSARLRSPMARGRGKGRRSCERRNHSSDCPSQRRSKGKAVLQSTRVKRRVLQRKPGWAWGPFHHFSDQFHSFDFAEVLYALDRAKMCGFAHFSHSTTRTANSQNRLSEVVIIFTYFCSQKKRMSAPDGSGLRLLPA